MNTFNDKINNIFQETDTWGTVYVTKNGKSIFEKYYGYTDYKNGKKWNSSSQHRIMSGTKFFTALTIMILYDKNKLDIDETIDNYGLEEIPNSDIITIKNIMEHKSGLDDSTGYFIDWDKGRKFNKKTHIQKSHTREELFNKIKNSVPKYKPGEQNLYSNSGYYLLGYIIEYVTNKKPHLVIKKLIIDNLNLNDTTFMGLKLKNPVYPYTYNRKLGGISQLNIDHTAGSIISSVKDLSYLLDNYDKLLQKKTVKLFNNIYRNNYLYKKYKKYSYPAFKKKNKIYNPLWVMGAGDNDGITNKSGCCITETYCIKIIEHNIVFMLFWNHTNLPKNKFLINGINRKIRDIIMTKLFDFEKIGKW